jgi:hypothetical protein
VTTAHDPFLTAALACVARGWPVIPLWPGTKKPAFHGYDRCPRTGPCADRHLGWEQRALSDPDAVRWYWTSRRGAGCNVGIPTGPAGLVGIDLDVPKPEDDPRPVEWDQPDITCGADVFLTLCLQAGQQPPLDTFTVRTGSGGFHLYYLAPPRVELRNSAGTVLGWKVDTRSAGGQLVAPGSIVNGKPYTTWLDTDPIPLPGWLVERLAAPPPAPPAEPVSVRHRSAYVDAAVRDSVTKVRATRVNRNAALYGAAVSLGQLVAGGQLSEREHAEALMAAADGHINAGAYSARQAAQTIASGLRAGMRNPRQVAA